MAKALTLWTVSHSFDSAAPNEALVFISFRFLGAESYLGMIDATAIMSTTDTADTLAQKIYTAVISKAADFGVTLSISDIIPLIHGFSQALTSTTNYTTVKLTDDGIDQILTGEASLGYGLFIVPGNGPAFYLHNPGTKAAEVKFYPEIIRMTVEPVFGTNDVFVRPYLDNGYAVFEGADSLGAVISTNNATPISMRPNRTEVANFDTNGLNMVAGAQVKNIAAPSGGKSVTNNVTTGGTADQGDDFTNLTIYATDAPTIRNNIYQLWQKLDRMADGLRTLGLLANS